MILRLEFGSVGQSHLRTEAACIVTIRTTTVNGTISSGMHSAIGVDAMIGGIPVILYWNDVERYIETRGLGVPLAVLQYSYTSRCEQEIFEQIKQIISNQSAGINKEIYHIKETNTCSLFFNEIRKVLRL